MLEAKSIVGAKMKQDIKTFLLSLVWQDIYIPVCEMTQLFLLDGNMYLVGHICQR